MPALRPIASVLILIAAVVLLTNAGVAIIAAIDTAFFGGGDEREEFATGVIQASGLPAAVAFLIAGTTIWQRTARLFRPLLIGIGLLALPIITASLIRVDGTGDPPLRLLTQVLVLALLGLAAAFGLVPLERGRTTTPGQVPVPVDPRGQKRRIAALLIALLVAVPLAPMIVFVTAISFGPLEAGQEPDVWSGVTGILFGIGMIGMVLAAAITLAAPKRAMRLFGAVAAWFAFNGLIAALGSMDSRGFLIFQLMAIAVCLFLGWLSRVPEE